MKSPVFILGIQRSGTTLLRLLLNSHSQISIPPEADFWLPFLSKYGNRPSHLLSEKEKRQILRQIEKHRYFRDWGVAIDEFLASYSNLNTDSTLGELMSALYSFHAKINSKVIWGDKTPPFCRYVKELKTIFPTAKFIHIVRDGRDQYVSRKTYTIHSAKRAANNVSVAAIEWNYKISKVKNGLSHTNASNSLEVRYEDLVTICESTLKKICDFLSINYEREMLSFWATSEKHISHSHSHLIFKPISGRSVCKWKNILTNYEQRKFEAISKKYLVRYGYQVSSNSFDPMAYAGVIIDLLTGLPQRMFYKSLATLDVYRRVSRQMDD